MIFFLFWGLVSLIAAIVVSKDAEQRGMNGMGWGIATFLLVIPVWPIFQMVRKPLKIYS